MGTIGRTPVDKIQKLAPEGVNLYVKIEAFNPMGSVKDRLALGIIEDAERRGKLKPGQTVIEATIPRPQARRGALKETVFVYSRRTTKEGTQK